MARSHKRWDVFEARRTSTINNRVIITDSKGESGPKARSAPLAAVKRYIGLPAQEKQRFLLEGSKANKQHVGSKV